MSKMSRIYRILPFFIFALLVTIGGCTSSESSGPAISNASFTFEPNWTSGQNRPDELFTPIAPYGLSLTSTDTGVRVSWKTHLAYRTSEATIGFTVYRKTNPADANKKWNFAETTSLDFETEINALGVAECDAAGLCSYLDEIKGPAELYYAVIAWPNITTRIGTKSPAAVANIFIRAKISQKTYSPGFTDKSPAQVIGTPLADIDRTPKVGIHSFESTFKRKLHFLSATESSDTAEGWFDYLSPIETTLSSDELTMYLPERGFNRATRLTRGQLKECGSFDPEFYEICQSLVYSRPFFPIDVFGQPSEFSQYTPADNPLAKSRQFESSSISVQTAASGDEYIFVADTYRILVRKKEIFGCSSDPGEITSAGYGIEGHCGFKWSIGTASPRLRCPFTLAGALRVGNLECTTAELNYAAADSTAPTDYSLRFPGAAMIKGAHLYIPDTGNSRVVIVKDFETKLAGGCGQLLSVDRTTADRACRFDGVLGQSGADFADAARFTKRSCIRGGERGGSDSSGPLAANAGFLDPLGSANVVGSACLFDTMTDLNSSGQTRQRRQRLAGDYFDSIATDISAETGLLNEKTRRTFRAPSQLRFDAEGNMYVLDVGSTIAHSPTTEAAASLASRIMIWSKNPFIINYCPDNTESTTYDCTLDDANLCSGTDCLQRQCFGNECNAQHFIGQPTALFGFTHSKDQVLGQNYSPTNYKPIAAMDISKTKGDNYGLWAVTGRNAEFLFWKSPLESNSFSVINNITDQTPDNLLEFRSGVFSGVTVDAKGGYVIGWDTRFHLGIGWTGD